MEIASSLLQAAFATLAATTVTVTDTDSYQFNPSMSQVEGCKRAEEKTKVRLIQKVYGQDFGSDSTMTCRETDKHQCSSLTNMYENSRGYIQAIKSRTEKVEGWTCTVSITAEVNVIKKTKSNIDASAQLDRVVYLPTDAADITVKTNTKGLVSVFQYDPVEDVVTKVFPAGRGGRTWTYFDRPLNVRVSLQGLQERDMPYYFFITVTDVPIDMLDQYRLHNFYQMWDNQPNKDKSLVRKSFNIARSKL